jgi:hypothetical protein
LEDCPRLEDCLKVGGLWRRQDDTGGATQEINKYPEGMKQRMA